MKLNLTANNVPEQRIKEYLEANASADLADKINNGTPIEKDGKSLINRKTLEGFFKWATTEARKLAEKGASFACVDDKTVFGWSIHYFEENAIEGEIFNVDGTPYKKVITPKEKPKANSKANTKTAPKTATPGTKPGTKADEPKKAKILPPITPKAPEPLTKPQKKKDITQLSIFDMF